MGKVCINNKDILLSGKIENVKDNSIQSSVRYSKKKIIENILKSIALLIREYKFIK